ncbi:DinB family protein [Paenibacillus glycanilyticus]|uniref:DNA damage-inducible protein DinB n=1 Tax=Paenibacillus glycanilyticus TaxID=126569 RepID=A0ABQ6GMG8_9BACL|nr:DinB family protein [Paenibacillus glycanilyticus]GLX71275.1 DNA damage-inducible protein DinB [Paenibacillus glycanilyticus]
MIKLFEYNWQVRKDWFEWCAAVSHEELMKQRTGGIGYILPTLYHIVAVEYGWICGGILQNPIEIPAFGEIPSLKQIEQFSERCHSELAPFVYGWNDSLEDRIMIDITDEGESVPHPYGEVMRHVIAHEIHHIGQLSVWSREIGKKPVTANLIGRGLYGVTNGDSQGL